MQIPKTIWDYYVGKLASINQTAANLMEQYVNAHGLNDADAVIDYAYALSTKYGETAGAFACQMYDIMAEAQGAILPAAEPAPTVTRAETAWDIADAIENSPTIIPSLVGKYVKMAAADTTLQNAKRDGGEFAWVNNGTDPCAFCRTLASRGWQDTKNIDEGDHAEHIHTNCQCEYAVRFRSDLSVEGYDPDALYEEYLNAPGYSPKEKINAMRREDYEQRKDEINAQKRAAYAKRKQREKEATT